MTCLRKLLSLGFRQTGRVQRGSLPVHELRISADRHGATFDSGGPICSGRLYQPTLESALKSRPASNAQCCTVVAATPASGADADPLLQPVGSPAARAALLARVCAALPSTSRTGCAHAQRVSCAGGSNRFQSDQRPVTVAFRRTSRRLVHAVALIDATDLPASCSGFKKKKPKLTRPIMQHWEAARSRPGKAVAL